MMGDCWRKGQDAPQNAGLGEVRVGLLMFLSSHHSASASSTLEGQVFLCTGKDKLKIDNTARSMHLQCCR